MRKRRKNKLYQNGGEFPNAVSYDQLGAIPDNRINYQPSIRNNSIGRPKSSYTKNKLFNRGGSINISVKSIDRNDLLHPADSNNLSYRNNPVGMSMTIKKSCYKPMYQSGGSVARTQQDYSEGLNNGKNIFHFNREGLKKMTMMPESGNIEYPINYEGYTNGVKTDEGRVQPGNDFEVDGDTIIETPDLSVMEFDKAFDYANDKKLPIFNWRGNKYPIRKYQDGGLFSSKVTDQPKLTP